MRSQLAILPIVVAATHSTKPAPFKKGSKISPCATPSTAPATSPPINEEKYCSAPAAWIFPSNESNLGASTAGGKKKFCTASPSHSPTRKPTTVASTHPSQIRPRKQPVPRCEAYSSRCCSYIVQATLTE